MDWFYLFLAGLFEIGWIISLKYTSGFTRLLPMLSYAFFGLGAAYFLSLALKSMPLGLTYAIWVGIGIAGSNILSIVLFEEPYHFLRILFILMILCGVAGLKFSSIR
jgi:quaternary ammonium compound-resistance protein SugE